MSNYQPVVTYCPASIDACGSWRMFYPKLYIPQARFIFTEGAPPLDELSESDVVVIQRMMMEGNLKWIKIIRQFGIKIIYDLDDNLWALPSANPAKRFFDSEDSIRGLEACAEWADVFTVSTTTLQRVVRQKWGFLNNAATKKPIPIIVCENRIPLTLYQRQEGISDTHEGVVVGWSGSNTHAGDFGDMDLWKILYELLEEMPEVKVELVGQPPPKYLLGHPRVTIRPWVHVSEYPARVATWNWDIILAPLEQHKFNKSKSCIRMQEAGALKKPCLATSITPYDEFVDKGSVELKYLLCHSGWQWQKKLRELVASISLRNELGEAMYQNVIENYRIELSVPEWLNAIEEAYNA